MSGSRMCNSQPELKAKKEQETLQMEMHGRYIGPMPVNVFLNTFLPTKKVVNTQCPADLFKEVMSTTKNRKQIEKCMYKPFVSIRHLIIVFINDDCEDHSDRGIPRRFRGQ